MLADRHRSIRAGRGAYRVKDAILARIAEASRSKAADAEAEERARLLAAQRQIAEIRAAERLKELIPVDHATAIIDSIVATFREGLDLLPAQISSDPATRMRVRDLCDQMLIKAAEKFSVMEKDQNDAED